jgi:tetratricopeptide (TPR) repeat protein
MSGYGYAFNPHKSCRIASLYFGAAYPHPLFPAGPDSEYSKVSVNGIEKRYFCFFLTSFSMHNNPKQKNLKDIIMANAKNVEEYIARQEAGIASNPDCGTSHYNLAVALIGLKKFDEAEKELQEAISCSPSLAEAYVQLGGLCLQRGDLDGCLNYNTQAVHARAGFSEGYGNIGFIHLQKGNIDEAIYALKKAITYNSSFLQAYTTLANAYLMKGLVVESIEANLKAIELEPNFAIAHNNLAIAYMENDQFDKAIEHCDKAKALGYAVAPEIVQELEQYR